MEDIKYTLSDSCLKIFDVQNVSKKDFISLEKKLREDNPNHVLFANRSAKNLLSEFCFHKVLYKLNIEVERTKDSDIQYPLTKKEYLVYKYFGWLFRILTK